MNLQEVSDRLEIQELTARYCHALDQQNWSAFHNLFTEDAVLDYSQSGGPKGSASEAEAFLAPLLQSLANAQHVTAAVMIDFTDDGDAAHVRSAAIVPLTARDENEAQLTSISGLSYEDEMRRTPAGWRISARRLVTGWAIGPLG